MNRLPHGTFEKQLTDRDVLAKVESQLRDENFWGTVIQTWQNGEVVLLKVEQTYKPKDFVNISLRVRAA